MARSTPDSGESDQFKLAASPSHLLHRAEQLASERFSHLVGDTITLRQFIILAAINEQPGLSQSDLGRIAGVDRSTLGDTMGKMERAAGSCAHRRPPMGGPIRSCSAKRAARCSATTQHARAADAAILDLLPKSKGRSFISTLTKLANLAGPSGSQGRATNEQKKLAKRKAREKAAEKTAKSRGRAQAADPAQRRQMTSRTASSVSGPR
ncbi:MAG: MarR family transcriptional regulator [Caulobacteraceae bacterium]|nr:MarR family transcriptional regulator [Caulobacteraceae bacterium]